MSFKKTVNALENTRCATNCFSESDFAAPAFRCVQAGICPDGVKFLFYSDANKKLFACTENKIYYYDGSEFIFKYPVKTGTPFAFEDVADGMPRTVIISGSTEVSFSFTTFRTDTLPFTLNCGVSHCGRLFGAFGYYIRWTGKDGHSDWTEGIDKSGYLALDPSRGRVLDLAVFSGRLVAVREYGLTVLSMYGSPENFSVDITDTDCDRVFKNTARTVGGKLMFCTESGAKCFDGNGIKAVATRNEIVSPTCAVEYGGKYFVACNGGIVCVDGERDCFIQTEADAMFAAGGVYFCSGGKIYKLEEGGEFHIESGRLDFGTVRSKTVTKIEVFGKADISISNGTFTRIFPNAAGVIRPKMRGINFIVEADGDSRVDRIDVTAEVTDAV